VPLVGGSGDRYRNLVERFFNKLKQFRGIATRYDKNRDNFLAAISLYPQGSGCAVMSLLPNTNFCFSSRIAQYVTSPT